MSADLSLLRARALEALDNRSGAIAAYQLCLQRCVTCFEALDCLMAHHLLTSRQECEFVASLPFEAQCGEAADTVKYLYVGRMKKYGGQEILAAELAARGAAPASIAACADAASARAEALYYRFDFRACHEITSRVLDTDPFHATCLPVHLACQVELRDTNGLFFLAHRLVDAYPQRAVSWFAVGCYYYLSGNNEAARRYFGKASQLDAHFGPAWVGFGHAFAAEGEHDQAMAAYCTAARLMTGCHLPLLFIGMEYTQTNNAGMARQYFEQAHAICDSDPLVHHELGVIHFADEDYDAAEASFQRALALCGPREGVVLASPTWEATLCNLARTYHRMGRPEEAVQCYEQAQSLCPDSAAPHAGLGFVLQCAGDPARAIECYHDALAIDAENSFCTLMLKLALTEELQMPDALGLDNIIITGSAGGGGTAAAAAAASGGDLSFAMGIDGGGGGGGGGLMSSSVGASPISRVGTADSGASSCMSLSGGGDASFYGGGGGLGASFVSSTGGDTSVSASDMSAVMDMSDV